MSLWRSGFLFLALWMAMAQGARLEGRVKRLLARSPAARAGFAGILIVDEKGRKLVAINADHVFVPASNTKLFSTALALERLGPEKRFQTRVEQRGTDLVLIGTGDANLSGRVPPYRYNAAAGPPLAAIDDLAAQIAAHGVHAVAGDVIGDDTAFLYEPYAPGWGAEDILYEDGAPVSALVVNDNAVSVRVDASAQTSLEPALPLFQIDSRVVSGAPENVRTDRLPNTNLWRIRGTIPPGADPYIEHWAVNDPAEFAATALLDCLRRRGIIVSGSARAAHRLPGEPFIAAPSGPVVAIHESPPLIEDLRLIDKVSQNLHADLLLFDVGGSREAGLQELANFLDGIGVKAAQYRFYDGSGLSRMNLVTPTAVVKLLTHMARSAHREDWLTMLPVSGVDGSLATRMIGPRMKGRIHAKTGTLNHVSALAGYADTRKGGRLTFSIFLNNSLAGAETQRELIDRICELFVE